MPRVPDASMVTRVVKANATTVADPTIKSRTFVAVLKNSYQASQLRASEPQRYVPGSVLALPRWTSPQTGRKLFVK